MRGSVSGVLRRKLDGTNMLRGKKKEEKRDRATTKEKKYKHIFKEFSKNKYLTNFCLQLILNATEI